MNRHNFVREISGIDYVKFLGVFAMIFLHGSSWVADRVSNKIYYQIGPILSEFVQVFMGFNSLSLPITAGFLLRQRISKYVVDYKIINFSSKNIFKLALFLFLFESIKGIFAVDFTVFFYWNVLHFIALSFIVIIFLMRVSMNLLILFTISVVVFTPIVNFYLVRLNNYYLNNLEFNFFALAVMITIILFILFNAIVKMSLKPGIKLQTFLILLSGVGFFFFYKRLMLQLSLDKFFAYSLVNIIFDIWISDSKTGHYWAFFPGFFLVAFGFIFSHFWNQIKTNRKIFLVTLVTSIVGIFIFFKFSYHAVLLRMEQTARYLYSKQETIFEIPSIIGLLSYFSLINLLADRLAIRVNWLRFSNPIYIFSRYILEIYVFHFILGIHLVNLIINHFSDSVLLVVLFPFILTIVSYLSILIYAYILEFSKLKVEFKKS